MLTLAEMIRVNSVRYAKNIALIFNKRKVSYRQLNEHVKKLASGLKGLGVKKGSKIAILLLNSPEFVISYFAITGLGAIVVPLNHMLKAEELKYILEDSEASIIITSSHFCEKTNQLRIRLEKLTYIITVDSEIPGTISLRSIYEKYPANNIEENVNKDDIAAILYTSGTTGKPKGAMLTHYNLLSNATVAADAIRATSRDNFLCILPMFHSFACTACVILPLLKGARTTIMESPQPFHHVIKNILFKRVTIFIGVPSIYNILKDAHLPRIFTSRLLRFLNPLRLFISGAAALPVETLTKFERKFRLPLLEGYGLTEASPVVSFNPLVGKRKAGSIGLPLKDIEVAIVSKDGNLLGPEEVGELLVNGPNVMKGYFKLPQATKETLKDKWLWTGDMAKMDKDGYIYIVDRKKDMVNVRGLNVYPKEIEELLYRHPKISEAAVIGVADKHKGEVPKAFIALKDGQTVTEQEIIHFCRKRMASFKVPKYVEFRKNLPKNATGKILKTALREESKK